MVGYFREIFTSSNPSYLNCVLNDMDLCITTNMVATLAEPFTRAEVLTSLHQTTLLKHRAQMVCLYFSFKNFGMLLKMM